MEVIPIVYSDGQMGFWPMKCVFDGCDGDAVCGLQTAELHLYRVCAAHFKSITGRPWTKTEAEALGKRPHDGAGLEPGVQRVQVRVGE